VKARVLRILAASIMLAPLAGLARANDAANSGTTGLPLAPSKALTTVVNNTVDAPLAGLKSVTCSPYMASFISASFECKVLMEVSTSHLQKTYAYNGGILPSNLARQAYNANLVYRLTPEHGQYRVEASLDKEKLGLPDTEAAVSAIDANLNRWLDDANKRWHAESPSSLKAPTTEQDSNRKTWAGD